MLICTDNVVPPKPSLNSLLPVIPRLAVRWFDLGLALGAKDFTLKGIDVTNKGDCEKCCKEMLHNWCNGKPDCGSLHHPVTWETLIDKVERAVNSEASMYIRREIVRIEDEANSPKRDSSESCTCVLLLHAVM